MTSAIAGSSGRIRSVKQQPINFRGRARGDELSLWRLQSASCSRVLREARHPLTRLIAYKRPRRTRRGTQFFRPAPRRSATLA
jgi:hypothetical protein